MSNTKNRLQRLFKPPSESPDAAFTPRDLSAPAREFNADGSTREPEPSPPAPAPRTTPTVRPALRQTLQPLSARAAARPAAPAPPSPSAPDTTRTSAQLAREAWLRSRQAQAPAPTPSEPPSPALTPSEPPTPAMRREHPLQLERDAEARARARALQADTEPRRRYTAYEVYEAPPIQPTQTFEFPDDVIPPLDDTAPFSDEHAVSPAPQDDRLRLAPRPDAPTRPSVARELSSTAGGDGRVLSARAAAKAPVLSADTAPGEVIALIIVHGEAFDAGERVAHLSRALKEKLHAQERQQALRLLSAAHAQLQEPENEVRVLQTLAELAPNDPWPKLRLVQLYREVLRDDERALEWAESALKSAPWHGAAKAMVQLLRQRQGLH